MYIPESADEQDKFCFIKKSCNILFYNRGDFLDHIDFE